MCADAYIRGLVHTSTYTQFRRRIEAASACLYVCRRVMCARVLFRHTCTHNVQTVYGGRLCMPILISTCPYCTHIYVPIRYPYLRAHTVLISTGPYCTHIYVPIRYPYLNPNTVPISTCPYCNCTHVYIPILYPYLHPNTVPISTCPYRYRPRMDPV
jgi:hypothetical protein